MKSLQITVLLCAIGFNLTAQEQASEPRQYYVSQEGRLYWPGDEPVYLFASQSADGSNPKQLQSESTPEYANPVYLDTEGVNYVRTKWAVNKETKKVVVPQQEVLFEIYNDGISPTTQHTLTGASSFTKEGLRFYGQNLTLKLTAKDQLSGVKKTYISLNGAAYQLYSDAIQVSQNAPFNFKYYSVDNVGNIEEVNEVSFEVDVVAPTTTHAFNGDNFGSVYSPRSSFDITSVDSRSGVKTIYYQIDQGTEKRFTNPISLKLADGDHSITYYAIDQVGNKEEAKTVNFYVDAIAPDVTATVVGDQYQNRGRVFVSTRTKVKLEASDNKAGIKKLWYKIDNEPEKEYTEPFELPRSKGDHTIMYYAVDNVNNDFKSLFDESKSGRQGLEIDMVAPEISYSFGGDLHTTRDTTFITSDTEIKLSAVDSDAGVKNVGYKINGGQGQNYTEPFKLTEEGVYVVDFYGTDLVNNRNTKEFFFVVDNTGPQIEIVLSSESVGSIDLDEKDQPLGVYSKGLKIYLGATDRIVDTKSIYYSINGAAEKLYTGPINIKNSGIVSYKVRAVDNLGNSSESETYEIFIK